MRSRAGFKAHAVALATVEQVAADLGVNAETLRNWIRAAGASRPRGRRRRLRCSPGAAGGRVGRRAAKDPRTGRGTDARSVPDGLDGAGSHASCRRARQGCHEADGLQHAVLAYVPPQADQGRMAGVRLASERSAQSQMRRQSHVGAAAAVTATAVGAAAADVARAWYQRLSSPRRQLQSWAFGAVRTPRVHVCRMVRRLRPEPGCQPGPYRTGDRAER